MLQPNNHSVGCRFVAAAKATPEKTTGWVVGGRDRNPPEPVLDTIGSNSTLAQRMECVPFVRSPELPPLSVDDGS
jgi:hypothetical protein